MKVLLTGQCGFIGKNLKTNLSKTVELEYIDKKQNSDRQLSLLNYSEVKKLINSFRPDYVIHLAARTDLNGYKLKDYDDNIVGTKNLLKACIHKNIKKIFIASTMLVDPFLNNKSTKLIKTTYGESKFIMENFCLSEFAHLPIVIGRITSAWGPGFSEPYRQFFWYVNKRLFVGIKNHSVKKTFCFIENLMVLIKSLTFENEVPKLVYLADDHKDLFNWSKEISDKLQIKECFKVSKSFLKRTSQVGEFINKFGFQFPLSNMKYHNLVNSNVIPLDDFIDNCQTKFVSQEDALNKTLKWMKENNHF